MASGAAPAEGVPEPVEAISESSDDGRNEPASIPVLTSVVYVPLSAPPDEESDDEPAEVPSPDDEPEGVVVAAVEMPYLLAEVVEPEETGDVEVPDDVESDGRSAVPTPPADVDGEPDGAPITAPDDPAAEDRSAEDSGQEEPAETADAGVVEPPGVSPAVAQPATVDGAEAEAPAVPVRQPTEEVTSVDLSAAAQSSTPTFDDGGSDTYSDSDPDSDPATDSDSDSGTDPATDSDSADTDASGQLFDDPGSADGEERMTDPAAGRLPTMADLDWLNGQLDVIDAALARMDARPAPRSPAPEPSPERDPG